MFNKTPVTTEMVAWLYRVFLGREPENQRVIESCLGASNFDVLRKNFVNSDEFKRFYFQSQVSNNQSIVVRCDIRHNLKLYIDLSDQYVSMGCLVDNYEPLETQFISNHLKPGDTFVDIGANIGWHVINAANIVGYKGRVFAFEPRDLSRDLLNKSIVDNNFNDRVTVYSCGLSSKPSTATLRWATDGANPGGATIDPAVNDLDHDSQTIELDTLDNYNFDRLDLIKIDIEGAELSAIRGGVNTIAKFKPIILSEIIDGQLSRVSGGDEKEYLSLMRQLGYDCYRLAIGGPQIISKHDDIFRDAAILNIAFIPRV